MSRAFVKEGDEGEGEPLPERALSPHPNFVTAAGLKALEARVRELEGERSGARAREDVPRLKELARELRYYQARRDSARLVEPTGAPAVVRFGVKVLLALADGSRREFRIVGEDEAAPGAGLISYVSPLAQALIGRRAGDVVDFAGGEAEIVELGC
jgi:transcription elongation GreA/GreB family factor